jgi:uncharacterized DUF497 family protein
MQYNFEWDAGKAKANIVKHGVSFEHAAMVFKDARAITVFDDGHSEAEDRWITIGITAKGSIIVVSHTYKEIEKETAIIRIISGRKATKKEREQYAGE